MEETEARGYGWGLKLRNGRGETNLYFYYKQTEGHKEQTYRARFPGSWGIHFFSKFAIDL